MARNNAMEEIFGEATILGQPALFTPGRVDRATVPDGYFMYEIRHDDENWSNPATIEKSVFANHYGTVITRNEITIPPPPDDYLNLKRGALLFVTSECRSMTAFMEKFPLGAENAEVSPEEEISGFAALEKRLDKNLADYETQLMGFGKQELIDMAGAIAATQDAYYYLTSSYGFEDDEIEYLLLFQNPLEIIADEWKNRQSDISDMGFAVDDVLESRLAIENGYPLMSELEPQRDNGLRRFMGVDLIGFLGKIAEKVIKHYPGDFSIDKDTLHRAAVSQDPEERRLMWHVSSWGTHMHTERETFIKGVGAHNYWVDYRPNEPTMLGFVLEVTSGEGEPVKGNVYEVGNYAEHAAYVRLSAIPVAGIISEYENGSGYTMSMDEFDLNRDRLRNENGNMTGRRFFSSDETALSELLRHERLQRRSLPIGSPEAHLVKLTEKLTEIRSVPEPATEHPATAVNIMQRPDKPAQTARPPRKHKSKAAPEKPSIEGRLKAAQKKANAQTPRKTPGNRKKDQSID